jgi:hypothetical protein
VASVDSASHNPFISGDIMINDESITIELPAHLLACMRDIAADEENPMTLAHVITQHIRAGMAGMRFLDADFLADEMDRLAAIDEGQQIEPDGPARH